MNRTVVVTGAASGLGRNVVESLVEKGWRVLAVVRAAGDAADLTLRHPAVAAVEVDLSQPAAVRDCAARIDRLCGEDGLAGIVHAAGYVFFSPLEHLDQHRARDLFEVLFWTPLTLSQALLPSLKRFARKSGGRPKIVNVVSRAALNADPWVGAYSAAKAALLSASDTQHYEFDRLGVDVVALVPGQMRTPFMERIAAQVRSARQSLSGDGVKTYGTSLDRLAHMADGAASNSRMGADSRNVAQQITRLLERSRPRSRSYVGADTRVFVFLNHFSPRAFRLWMSRMIFR